jgi:predicted RNase H-like HicB family nuclease
MTRVNNVEYTVIIEPADDGTFSVYVPDLPGCISTGTTRENAIESIREAIAGHIQTRRDLGEPVPPPRSQSHVVAA